MAPIEAAVTNDHVSIVYALLHGGAQTSLTRLFSQAIRYGATRTTAYLLYLSKTAPSHVAGEISQRFLRDGNKSLLERLPPDGTDNGGFHIDIGKALLVTCLMDRDREDIAKLLIEYGADIADSNPLHGASLFGNKNVVRLLVDHGSLVDAKNWDEETPLHSALEGQLRIRYANRNSDYPATVKLLLDRGSDPNMKTRQGKTALHYAAMFEETEYVQLLLSGGANVHELDSDGHNALYQAFACGNAKTTKLLHAHGASLKSLSQSELDTLLLISCRSSLLESAQLLIDEGADVNYRSPNPADWGLFSGSTPLLRAIAGGYSEIVTLLVERGADVNAVGSFCYLGPIFEGTPLEVASYFVDKPVGGSIAGQSIVKLLKELGATGDKLSFHVGNS